MMGQAILTSFEETHGIGEDQLDKLTYIPLDGEGKIEERVEKLYKVYLSKPEWVADIRRADAIFVASHSQGCIVAVHLLSRLISQGHIRTAYNTEAVVRCERAFGSMPSPGHTWKGSQGAAYFEPAPQLPKVALLAMCGVHLGPFYNAAASTVITPYLWFEHPAARCVLTCL